MKDEEYKTFLRREFQTAKILFRLKYLDVTLKYILPSVPRPLLITVIISLWELIFPVPECTTFSWLYDVVLTHVHGVVTLLVQTIII